MLPSSGKSSSKFHNNPTFGHRDRRDSLDSFDLQFNNSFDAALDNLKISNNTDNLSRHSVSDSLDNFEMTSMGAADSYRSNNGKSIERDNRPLIDGSDGDDSHPASNDHPRKFQSIPRSNGFDSFVSIVKNAFT